MKTKILVDIKVVCDPPSMGWYRDIEQQAKAMERWCRDFNEFIRDHRSQDQVDLSVERVYEDVCSHCKSTYEDEPGCCDAAIAEWEALKVKVSA